MRRSVLLGLIFLLLVAAALVFAIIKFGSGSNAISLPSLLAALFPTSTPNVLSPTAVSIFSTPSPSRTPVPTPSLTPSPTLDLSDIRQTADAYATAHTDALGNLIVPFDSSGITPRVTFSEAEVNALIAPFLPEVPNASNVHLDLLPGGATLTADLHVLGLTLRVDAAAQLAVQDGQVAVSVTSASIGGISPPAAALEAVNDTLIPMVNAALNTGLGEYGPREQIDVLAVQTAQDALIVDFILRAEAPLP